MGEQFEPIIVCYCCQWCSYAAADLSGSMRLQYPTNVRIVKVPCTGRVRCEKGIVLDGAELTNLCLSGCNL